MNSRRGGGEAAAGCLGGVLVLLLIDLLLKMVLLPLFGIKFDSWWSTYSKCLGAIVVVAVVIALVAAAVVQIVIVWKGVKGNGSTEDDEVKEKSKAEDVNNVKAENSEERKQ